VEIELLKKLVSIPSFFGHEERISEFIASFLELYAKRIELQEVEECTANNVCPQHSKTFYFDLGNFVLDWG